MGAVRQVRRFHEDVWGIPDLALVPEILRPDGDIVNLDVMGRSHALRAVLANDVANPRGCATTHVANPRGFASHAGKGLAV